MKPETRFKDRVKPRLQSIPKIYFYKTQQVALKGIPDFVGCANGRFFALELKSEKGRATPLQMKVLRDIEDAGGFARVMNPENADRVLDDLRLFSEGRVGMMSTTLE